MPAKTGLKPVRMVKAKARKAPKGSSKRAVPKARKPAASRKSARGNPRRAVMAALDARHGTHVPGPNPVSPYTVIRSRTTQSITTSTSGQNIVMLLCPYANDTFRGGQNYCQVIGGWGVGTNAPSTGVNLISDSVVKNFTTGQVSLSLHSMTAEVQATGTATTAEGIFYIGTLVGRPFRGSYATWNSVAESLVGRRELRTCSAYQSLSSPKVVVSYPIDVTEWSLLQDFANTDVTTLSNNTAKDTLGTIAVCWLPTATAVNYVVTVTCEWRVVYHNDLQLSSTHQSHPTTQSSMWQKISAAAASESGHVMEALTGGGVLGAMATGLRQELGLMGQTAGLIARYSRPLLALA